MPTLWQVAIVLRAKFLQPASTIKFTHDLHTQGAPQPDPTIVLRTCHLQMTWLHNSAEGFVCESFCQLSYNQSIFPFFFWQLTAPAGRGCFVVAFFF